MCDYISMFNEFMEHIFTGLYENEKNLSSSQKTAIYKGDEETIVDYIDEIAANINSFTLRWVKTPNKYLNGKTPEEHYKNLDDFQEVFNSFKYLSSIFDYKIPDIIVDKLITFPESYDEMVKIITDKSMLYNEMDINIYLSTLSSMVNFSNNSFVIPLIEFMKDLNAEEFDNILENIVNILLYHEEKVIDPILDILESEQQATYRYSRIHMITLISKVSKPFKSDRIFKCLKAFFNNSDDKVFPALLLSDYNDGRAVSLLRGYINKNKSTIDKITYHELKYAIESLGGTV